MTWMEWYNSLWKPSWTPAPATIGLIWQILYPIIIVTFGFVFLQAVKRKLPWSAGLPFAINLLANLIFTPIQFGMRNLPLAAVDIPRLRESSSYRSYSETPFNRRARMEGNDRLQYGAATSRRNGQHECSQVR